MKTLIIFAKAPILGQVKTRLAKARAIGKKGALALYQAFLEDTILMAACASAQTIAIHFTPDDAEPAMRNALQNLLMGARNERRFTFAPQVGLTFAERIAHSFRQAGAFGGEDLVMIGADSPLIRPAAVDQAFDFIHEKSGMVLGPSAEGGLYLIGFQAGAPIDFSAVFDSGSELENMLAQAKAGNIPLLTLPETMDVDVEADLVGLLGQARALAYRKRKEEELYIPERTIKAIDAMRLTVVRQRDGTRNKKVKVAHE
jgi:hypothetical protein